MFKKLKLKYHHFMSSRYRRLAHKYAQDSKHHYAKAYHLKRQLNDKK